MSLSQAILPQSSIDLMASLLSTSLTLHRHYWLALNLLRTNHRPLLSLYKQHAEVLSTFFMDFLTLEDGNDSPKTSVRNSHSTLCSPRTA
jgi:hypothetical protein